MNRQIKRLSAICAAVVFGSVAAWADKVPLAQVPEAVQKAIKEQSKGETVQDVERETRDGQTVYQAEFKREGLNRRLTFAADGSVLPGKADRLTDAFWKRPSLQLSEVPEAVRKTIRDQQAGRAIADLDKEMWNGQPVYEVEFKEKGPNSRLHVATDGTLVMEKRQGRGLFMGTQLSETPQAVRATVKRLAGTAEIADVDKETRDGQTIYEVEIRQEGVNREIHVADNGTLLKDTEGMGAAPGGRERVRGTDQDNGRDLFGRKTVLLDDLPAAVQSTIKAQGELSTLKPIKEEKKDGVVCYAVEFEKDGRNVRLKIAEDGRILEDNRP